MKILGLLVALVALMSSCSLKRDIPEDWQKLEVNAPSDRILWKVANMSLNSRGFPRGKLSLADMEIETGWRNDLSPFRGRGHRTKAFVEMDPVEKGRWLVRARVHKERNMNLGRPLSLPDAEWEQLEDDKIVAQVILQHIFSLLPDDFEVREEVDPIDQLMERANSLEMDTESDANSR